MALPCAGRYEGAVGCAPPSYKGVVRENYEHAMTEKYPPTDHQEEATVPVILPTDNVDVSNKKISADLKVGQKLGNGISSDIYTCENLLTGRSCALKLFRRELGIDSTRRGRYSHELHLLSLLENRHIADVYHVGVAVDGRTYAVQKLVKGTSLRSAIQRLGSIPQTSALDVAKQVANALAVAHGHHIPHCRLHPGNILLDSRSENVRATLLDFGVRQLYIGVDEDILAKVRTVEQCHYLSPEQLSGRLGDNRADIYALGIIVYQLLTGKLPFEGRTFDEVAEKQLSHAAKPPSDVANVDKALSDAILQALEKNPNRRFLSVEAFIRSLDPRTAQQHSLRKRPTGAQRVWIQTPSGRHVLEDAIDVGEPSSTSKRRRKFLLLAALAGTAAACATAAFLLTRNKAEPRNTTRLRRRKPRMIETSKKTSE